LRNKAPMDKGCNFNRNRDGLWGIPKHEPRLGRAGTLVQNKTKKKKRKITGGVLGPGKWFVAPGKQTSPTSRKNWKAPRVDLLVSSKTGTGNGGTGR